MAAVAVALTKALAAMVTAAVAVVAAMATMVAVADGCAAPHWP